ncbi:MAG: hypothetical protein AAFV49_15690 [Pseudomonadota bacterium]
MTPIQEFTDVLELYLHGNSYDPAALKADVLDPMGTSELASFRARFDWALNSRFFEWDEWTTRLNLWFPDQAALDQHLAAVYLFLFEGGPWPEN